MGVEMRRGGEAGPRNGNRELKLARKRNKRHFFGTGNTALSGGGERIADSGRSRGEWLQEEASKRKLRLQAQLIVRRGGVERRWEGGKCGGDDDGMW